MFSIRGEWMRKWLQYVSIPSPVILSVSVCNIVRDAAWVPAYGSIDCIARNGQLPLQERYRSVFVFYADTVEHHLKVHAWSVHFTSGCSSMTSLTLPSYIRYIQCIVSITSCKAHSYSQQLLHLYMRNMLIHMLLPAYGIAIAYIKRTGTALCIQNTAPSLFAVNDALHLG